MHIGIMDETSTTPPLSELKLATVNPPFLLRDLVLLVPWSDKIPNNSDFTWYNKKTTTFNRWRRLKIAKWNTDLFTFYLPISHFRVIIVSFTQISISLEVISIPQSFATRTFSMMFFVYKYLFCIYWILGTCVSIEASFPQQTATSKIWSVGSKKVGVPTKFRSFFFCVKRLLKALNYVEP